MTPRDLLLAILVMALWGFNYVALKVTSAYLPPFLALGLRFLMVGLFVFTVRLPIGHFRLLFAFAAVLGLLHFGLMMVGIGQVDASTAAILLQAQVPFSTLLGALVYGERPRARDLLGVAIAFLGTAVIAGQPQGGTALGITLLIAAAFFWSVATLIAKRLSGLPPMAITAWSSLFMVPMMALQSVLFDADPGAALRLASWPGYLGVLYMALASSVAAYGVWFALMRRVPLPKLMPTVLLTPVFAVAASVLLLGEQLSARFLAGAVLTLVGLAVVFIRPQALAAKTAG